MTDTRNIIGYIEQEDTFAPLYEPEKGSIVTQAFILCKKCNSAIYHCMGPRSNAVCLDCFKEIK